MESTLSSLVESSLRTYWVYSVSDKYQIIAVEYLVNVSCYAEHFAYLISASYKS